MIFEVILCSFHIKKQLQYVKNIAIVQVILFVLSYKFISLLFDGYHYLFRACGLHLFI